MDAELAKLYYPTLDEAVTQNHNDDEETTDLTIIPTDTPSSFLWFDEENADKDEPVSDIEID